MSLGAAQFGHRAMLKFPETRAKRFSFVAEIVDSGNHDDLQVPEGGGGFAFLIVSYGHGYLNA